MFELGMKDVVPGVDNPKNFMSLGPNQFARRPEAMPLLDKHWSLVCGFDQGLGERLLVCATLEDAQELYDAYYNGSALRISWYRAFDVGSVLVVDGKEA